MTAADQPTTEPSEADVAAFKRGWHKADQNRHHFAGDRTRAGLRAVFAARVAAPAPQPAADTETEVQWGVRVDVTRAVVPFTTQERATQAVRAIPVGVVVTRTVTRWEEA